MKGTLTKAVTVSLVIIVLALAFLATFQGSQLYQSQKKASELQKQVTSYENMMNTPPNVTITDISSGDWYFQEHYGPPPYYKPFNVTFENLGPMSIGGITIKYKVEGNPTNIGDDFLIYVGPHQLGILHPQESKTYHVTVVTSYLERKATLAESRLTLTLMLDDLVLDEKSMRIG